MWAGTLGGAFFKVRQGKGKKPAEWSLDFFPLLFPWFGCDMTPTGGLSTIPRDFP